MKSRLRVILIVGFYIVAIIFGLFNSMKKNDIVNGSIGFGTPLPTSAVSKEEQDRNHKKMIEIVQNYRPLKTMIDKSPNKFSFTIVKVEGTDTEIVRVKKKVDRISFMILKLIS
jgi:hypothetical protein